MSFQTASFSIPMYSLAMLDHGVPSSRSLNIVLILFRNLFIGPLICFPEASHTIASWGPATFTNYFIVANTLDLDCMGIAYTYLRSVINS